MISQRLSPSPREHARIILATVGFERADQTIAENVLTHEGASRRYWLEVQAALWRLRRLAEAPTVEE